MGESEDRQLEAEIDRYLAGQREGVGRLEALSKQNTSLVRHVTIYTTQ